MSGWPSGERLRARRAVLADVPAPHLYRSLVGEAPSAGAAAPRPRPVPLGQRHREGQLGDVGADPVAQPGSRGGRAPCTSAAGLDDLTRTAADLATGRVPNGRSCCSAR